MRQPKVVVIGAGIGGLAAALRLAARGFQVTVVEAASAPGGKLREICVGGAQIDAGPTVFTMRWVFDELAADVGAALENWLTLQPAQTLARHAWGDGGRLDLFADIERSVDAIGCFAGAREADAYRSYCAHGAALYSALRDSYIRASRPNPLTLTARIGLTRIGDLRRLRPYATLWDELGRYFRDPRLRQLFARYATYCGSSPFAAPATLMLVSHVEREGVWLVDGGMQRLAMALAAIARFIGVRFHFSCKASRIIVKNGRARGVRLEKGEDLPADAVVMNGDIGALAQGFLGGAVAAAVRAPPPAARSLSALTFAIKASAQGFPLLRHNVFFSSDYASEFDDIGRNRRLPRAPTVYVCAQDRGSEETPEVLLPESQRLFCLVNAPAQHNSQPLAEKDILTCQEAMFRHLDRCGLHIDHRKAAIVTTTPNEFAEMFPGSSGALYGRASHGWMAAFLRPGARTRLPGLYLAGGGVHPGPGVPMAALSGRQAAMSVITDLASIDRLSPAAMPGGTWTRSAMTSNPGSSSSPLSAASSPPTTRGRDGKDRKIIAP